MISVHQFELPEELLIVGAAVQKGLFDALRGKSLSLEELADCTECDTRALWVVTEALMTMGYLEHEAEKIKLSQEAWDCFFNPDSKTYLNYSFMHTYNLLSVWLHLPEVLTTGRPVDRDRPKDSSKNFIAAMNHYAKEGADDIVKFCLRGLPKDAKVLDVGGGPLTIAQAFADAGAQVVVLDLPEVVDMMSPELDGSTPVSMVKGDFREGLPGNDYDMVYLGNLSHAYGEKENRKLLSDAFKVLSPWGKVVINDFLRGTGRGAEVFAVNMLVNTESGGTFSFAEYEAWLKDAGFVDISMHETRENQFVVAKK